MDVSSLDSRPTTHGVAYGAHLVGPQLCFEEIYREYFEYVWTNLRRLGVSDLDLDDAVQDVFLIMHRRADEFEGRSTVKTWLYGIARRIAFRYRRAAERSRRRSEALALLDRERGDLDRDLATRQAWRLLYAFLDTLDEEKREAFVIGEFEGLNRQQLGHALGVNPNTAYSRLRAARERFERTFASEARRRVLVHGELSRRPRHEDRQRVWALLVPQIGWPMAGGHSPGTELVAATDPVASASTGTVGSVGLYLKAAIVAGAVAAATTLGISGWFDGHSDAASGRDDVVVAGIVPTAVVAEVPGGADLGQGQLDRTASSRADTTRDTSAAAIVEEVTKSEQSRRPVRRRKASRSKTAADSGVSTSASRLADEVQLIQRARTALSAGQGARTLSLLARHADEHRNGELAVVRRTLRIDALCQTGEVEQAAREARAFLAEHANSSEAAHVRRSCGASGN